MEESAKSRKRNIRSVLIAIIAAELLAAAAACYAVVGIAMTHICDRRSDMITASISGFDTAAITSDMEVMIAKAREGISKEMEQDVWTKDYVNYRTGPGTQYESAGVLGIYSGVKRTGVTYNKWSRVLIDDKEYYVSSKFLTKEQPLITDGGAKGEYQKYALSQFGKYGWAASEIVPLIKLWNRESGWNPNSHNRSSGAHGIPQALPAGKMASEGSDYYTNGNTQIRWGLGYISRRYGSPSAAWNHFCSRGWY